MENESNKITLKPCPFCGGNAEFEREGNSRHSCIVVCTYCGARHESGDTLDSGSSWNRRVGEREETILTALVPIE